MELGEINTHLEAVAEAGQVLKIFNSFSASIPARMDLRGSSGWRD